jgi:hypothetical protein
MWSGPRNISTAMMRAWENRADTAVVDEPFYACYLKTSGIVHPMQAEVLASQSADWQEVIDEVLKGPLPAQQTIQYQKHMTHHMLNQVDAAWFGSIRHAFLIRHPAQVVASYGRKRGSVTAEDIGFERQAELYELAVSSGANPAIIDGADVLRAPEIILCKLCEHLRVPFDENMLGWPAGSRDSDGAWAPHWYNKVEQSTGFGPYSPKSLDLNQQQQDVVDQCLPYYQSMHEKRLLA